MKENNNIINIQNATEEIEQINIEIINLNYEIENAYFDKNSIIKKYNHIFKEYKKAKNELNMKLKILRDLEEKKLKSKMKILKLEKKKLQIKEMEMYNHIDWKNVLDYKLNPKKNIIETLFHGSILSCSGHFPETDQYCIKIKFFGDSSEEELLFSERIILKIKENFIPFKGIVSKGDVEFNCYISIFENTMGKNGKYSLVYCNNKWGILSSRGWQEIIKEFNSISEGLKYIKQKYWYLQSKPEYN